MKKKYTSKIKYYIIKLFAKFSYLILKDKFIENYSTAVLSKYKEKPILVNIGAGSFSHPLWVNMDHANDFYGLVQGPNMVSHDLTLKSNFPFDDEKVDVYYCSHVIEHLSNECVQKMFEEVYRTLKPGGIFRIVCPDMEHLYDDLKNGNSTIISQIRPWGSRYTKMHMAFLEHFCTLLIHSNKYSNHHLLNEEVFYNELNKLNMDEVFEKYVEILPIDANKLMPQGHCNWFTFGKLSKMLEFSGFKKIQRSEFCKSKHVELRSSTLFDNTSPEISLYIEATK
jgi:ubiquinone/menaquinone biosynthesis C-methylase UbiE